MRWQSRRRSTQVEDRRGMRAGGPRLAVGGCGTLVVVLILSWITGVNPLELLQVVSTEGGSVATGGGTGSTPPGAPPADASPEEQRLAEFASVVLADTEETWSAIFEAAGSRYELPTLVLFRDAVDSGCGHGSSAMGPFYCPRDGRLYVDLAFFADLDRRFGAPGDFAQAYVVAHEVGHHVQNLLGDSERVQRAQQQAGSRADANELSVRLELQADCYAGVWGHHANRRRQLLEPGDVEEGLQAAAAIGDDRLQRQSGGAVAPESWTHGSSQMRVEWLRRGLESGDPNACDTFGG
jgi:predicted metalloprotease